MLALRRATGARSLSAVFDRPCGESLPGSALKRRPLTEDQKRRAMRRDLGAFAIGALVMAVGALLWMRVVVACERVRPGESARCVVTQKRLFGFVPFWSWTTDGVRRAAHDVIESSYSQQDRIRRRAPSSLLVLDGQTLRQPVESGSDEAVAAAEFQLNVLLTASAPGRAQAELVTWMPGVFALIVGLIPAFAGGQRAWLRRKGADPDAVRSRRR